MWRSHAGLVPDPGAPALALDRIFNKLDGGPSSTVTNSGLGLAARRVGPARAEFDHGGAGTRARREHRDAIDDPGYAACSMPALGDQQETLPLLPLLTVPLFPGTSSSLDVGRGTPASMAIQHAFNRTRDRNRR